MVSPSVYSFDVVAPTARSAHGNLALETDAGWFRVPFGPFELTQATRHMTNAKDGAMTSMSFRSPIQYVNFGKPVTIRGWWVENAASDGADWSDVGLFACSPELISNKYAWHPIPAEGQPYTSMPAGARAIAAQPVPPILRTDCAKPFVDASVVKQVSPDYPFTSQMNRTTSTILVTILPNGVAVDATVFKSSGLEAFDIAAISAAMRSTYTPKIAFCKPTIGRYLWKVMFD